MEPGALGGGEERRAVSGEHVRHQLVEHLERLPTARNPRRLRLFTLGLWLLLLSSGFRGRGGGCGGNGCIGFRGGGGGGSCDWERCGWLERRAEEPRKRCLARWLWLHLGLDRQQILGVGALLDVAPRLAVQAAQLGLKRVRSVQVEHVMAVGATATATVGQRSAGARKPRAVLAQFGIRVVYTVEKKENNVQRGCVGVWERV